MNELDVCACRFVHIGKLTAVEAKGGWSDEFEDGVAERDTHVHHKGVEDNHGSEQPARSTTTSG
jgi:hypothetical protein